MPSQIALTGNLPDPLQATLQRFISRDPIGLEGGANLYAYVGANPTRLIDPSGLDPTLALGAGTSGILSGIGTGSIIVDTALLGTSAASATVVFPAAILGAGIADGMRPVPGTGRGPFFGDLMGADRWGSRVYDPQSNYTAKERQVLPWLPEKQVKERRAPKPDLPKIDDPLPRRPPPPGWERCKNVLSSLIAKRDKLPCDKNKQHTERICVYQCPSGRRIIQFVSINEQCRGYLESAM